MLFLSLVLHRFDVRGSGLGIEVPSADGDRTQVVVQFIEKRDPRGDVEPCDGIVRNLVQMLDQGAKAVPMGCHEYSLIVPQIGYDGVVPVGQHACDNVFQAFRTRAGLGGQGRVPRVVELGELRVDVQFRRRGVVRTPPNHELLLAEFVADLGLVLALQRAVVAFVEPPRALDRDPVAVAAVQGEVRGVDGPPQHGGVDHIRQQVFALEQLGPPDRFGGALLSDVHIHPAGEQVFSVPFGFAMSKKNQCVRHVLTLYRVKPRGRNEYVRYTEPQEEIVAPRTKHSDAGAEGRT